MYIDLISDGIIAKNPIILDELGNKMQEFMGGKIELD